MGSQNSVSSQCISLRIHLEFSTYCIGEEVCGAIHLVVKNPCKLSELFMKFSGKEVTNMQEHPNKDSGKQNKMFKKKILYHVHEWQKVVLEQTMSIPFRFVLPIDIPGSINYKRNSVYHKITYHLVAFIYENKTKVYNKVPIVIRQDPIEAEKPLSVLYELGFKHQTKCELSVILDSEVYNSSRVAIIKVEIDNSHSKGFVNTVEAQLCFLVKTKSKKKVFTYTDMILKTKVKINICPGEKRKELNAVAVELDLPKAQKILSEFPSVCGVAIESVYYLVVRAGYKGIFGCNTEMQQVMAFIKIAPVIEVTRVSHVKPDDNLLYYPSVELKGYEREVLSTEY